MGALWFRTNCGLRPYALRSKAFVALLVSAVLLAGGVHYTLPTLFFIGGCSGCWACLVIFMSLCLPSHLWKLIMLQLPLFIGVTLVAQHWFLGSLGIEICAAPIVGIRLHCCRDGAGCRHFRLRLSGRRGPSLP